MLIYEKEQTCPYCGITEEEHRSLYEDATEIVTCSSCDKDYQATAHYHFLGYETKKICEVCNETENECYCNVVDVEREEQ